MPAYNCEVYVSKSIYSVIEQTYRNWELIICDDASSDNTYQELCLLAQEDARIILLKNEKNLLIKLKKSINYMMSDKKVLK